MFQHLNRMANTSVPPALRFKASEIFGNHAKPFSFLPIQSKDCHVKTLVAKRRANTRTEKAKIRNRRMQKKFNGTPIKPRLSVFCSTKQLYAMLVDDQNKKCLFYGSTLQKSLRDDPPRSKIVSPVSCSENFGEKKFKKEKLLAFIVSRSAAISEVHQEAAEHLGEELIKACVDMNINEISSYDRNGFARGERMQAFEVAISRHGFLPR